jgi:hypothetical protein
MVSYLGGHNGHLENVNNLYGGPFQEKILQGTARRFPVEKYVQSSIGLVQREKTIATTLLPCEMKRKML